MSYSYSVIPCKTGYAVKFDCEGTVKFVGCDGRWYVAQDMVVPFSTDKGAYWFITELVLAEKQKEK